MFLLSRADVDEMQAVAPTGMFRLEHPGPSRSILNLILTGLRTGLLLVHFDGVVFLR